MLGGTGAITHALGALMSRQGIESNIAVSAITVVDGAATGLVLADGRAMATDIVVSNADLRFYGV
jgi:phytoene dehydrogenase-like protein